MKILAVGTTLIRQVYTVANFSFYHLLHKINTWTSPLLGSTGGISEKKKHRF